MTDSPRKTDSTDTRPRWRRVPSRRVRRVAVIGGVALAALVAAWLAPAPLPDFSAFDRAGERKQAFFDYLAPIVAGENGRVLEQRRQLRKIAPRIRAGRPLAPAERHWLRELAAEYELAWPGESRSETLAALERRVDVVPVSLALVQAATESGWGRSRFARLGNNLFGQWCYESGCGIVPGRRNEDAAHEVAAFDSVRESVRRYINNLNTHPSYASLRRIRAAERDADIRPRALSLADGLLRYSERREAYVEEIKQIIRANRPLIEQARGIDSAAAAGEV